MTPSEIADLVSLGEIRRNLDKMNISIDQGEEEVMCIVEDKLKEKAIKYSEDDLYDANKLVIEKFNSAYRSQLKKEDQFKNSTVEENTSVSPIRTYGPSVGIGIGVAAITAIGVSAIGAQRTMTIASSAALGSSAVVLSYKFRSTSKSAEAAKTDKVIREFISEFREEADNLPNAYKNFRKGARQYSSVASTEELFGAIHKFNAAWKHAKDKYKL
ncbi:possible Fanconi anaemia group C protein [Prochlorococcus marinus str. MIT 9313]|uniref:Possible Fanconi anaemia group C protein n=1 Tax=Prochlorococcus marinus (strain MIT 9313) TaxID=74547 RepID=Q7V8N6_PROMM|nr:hypothetical protein [Prochlorococcus marinus]CAE20476.1 possible Fanconi anaemia group C protein [Prochlorococcus marinus str. MIT 9313]